MTKGNEMTDIRQELSALMKAKGISQDAVAKAIDRSGSTVNQFLKGKYPGENANVELEKRLRAYLEKFQGREQVVSRDIKFIQTYNAQIVYAVARQCELECEIGVLVSEVGMGKTEGAREYQRQNPESIYIEVDTSFSARSLFLTLCELLELPQEGTLHDLVNNQVVRKLKGTKRLVIIDQAEYLPERALELLRTLYDKAKVGVLLIGKPRLEHNLRKARSTHEQIYSRVGFFQRLKTPLNLEEVTEIVNSRIAIPADFEAFLRLSGGNGRRLDKLIRRASSIAQTNNIEINADVVAEAHSMLMA